MKPREEEEEEEEEEDLNCVWMKKTFEFKIKEEKNKN